MTQFLPNVHHLPDPLYLALTTSEYEKQGDYSVTGLINPPQITELERRYDYDIWVDPFDRLASMIGSAIHARIEKFADPETHLVEQRVRTTVRGFEVTGQPDVLALRRGVLYDYKTCKTWVSEKGAKREWEEQLNAYAHMLREQGEVINEAKVVAIYLDWSKLKLLFAQLRKGYFPEFPVEIFPIELWEDYEVDEWLDARVLAHEKARYVADEDLPPCTREEQWREDDVWAVKKTPTSKAVRGGLLGDEDAAYAMADEIGGIVEHRPGKALRCLHYCVAARFCRQKRREEKSDVEEDFDYLD